MESEENARVTLGKRRSIFGQWKADEPFEREVNKEDHSRKSWWRAGEDRGLGRQSEEIAQNTPIKLSSRGPSENEEKSESDISDSWKIRRRKKSSKEEDRGEETGCRRSWIFAPRRETRETEPDQTTAEERERKGEIRSQPVLGEKGALGKRLSLLSGSKERESEKRGGSFWRRSNKPSKENLVFRGMFFWDPRVYIRKTLLSVGIFLHFVALSVVSCWGNINRGFRIVGRSTVGVCKSAVSAMVDLTPRKIIKGFMIHTLRILPCLRHRSAVVYLLDILPSRVTKRVVSVYIKKVPVRFMRFHVLASLRDGPIKKIIEGFTKVIQFPRTLLQLTFMTLASALEVISRALTFPRGRPPEQGQRLSRLPSLSIKRQSSLPSELERKL